MIGLLFLFLQSSFCFKKWALMVILPSNAADEKCLEDKYNDAKRCDENSEFYGGPEACEDLFDSLIRIPCIRDDNANIDDILSKLDKSIEIITIDINLEKDITFDFSKLPSKMKVILLQSSSFGRSYKSRLLNTAKLVQNIENGNKNVLKPFSSNKKEKEDIRYTIKIKGYHNDKLSS